MGGGGIPIVDDIVDVVDDVWDDTTDVLEDAWDDTTDFLEDAWDDTTDFLEDAWDDTEDWVSDTAEDIGDLATDVHDWVEDQWSNIGNVMETYYDFYYSQYDLAEDFSKNAVKGDWSKAFKSLDRNLQKYGNSMVSFHTSLAIAVIDFHSPVNAMDRFGSSSQFGSSEYLRLVVRGADALGKAAITGDEKALLQLGIIIVSVALTAYSLGSAAPATTPWIATALGYVTAASAAATAYGILDTLHSIGLMTLDQYSTALSATRKYIEGWDDKSFESSVFGGMNEWMAGGIFFNSIYAGGALFNETGSRSQTRFLKNPDPNANSLLSRRLGSMHNPYRKLKTHNIGGEEFSVFIFGKK